MADTLVLILAWIMVELIIPVMAWCKDVDTGQMLDPLWVVMTSIGAIIGFLQWSLSRNVKTLDEDIKEMKQELIRLREEIRCQRDKLIALKTSHEDRLNCLTRKGD